MWRMSWQMHQQLCWDIWHCGGCEQLIPGPEYLTVISPWVPVTNQLNESVVARTSMLSIERRLYDLHAIALNIASIFHKRPLKGGRATAGWLAS